MKYILVRHVETVGNVEHRFNGITESDYTERGIAMKRMLEDELVRLNTTIPINKIYTSPIKRAYHIAEGVADRLNMDFTPDNALKEFNFGIFDGLTVEEARQKDPILFDAWMADYNHVPMKEGDNYEEYHQRIKNFILTHETEDRGKNILVVAHGGTVQSMMLNLLDLPLDSKWHFLVELGSITIIEVIDGFGMLSRLYAPDYGKITL